MLDNIKQVDNLKELFDIQPSIWLGNYAPFNTQMVNILDSESYRLASELHGKYKAIWFYEHLLSDVYAWKIILDEMIRLIDKEGVFIVRFEQNHWLNIIELKNFLGRSILIDSVKILYQKMDDNEISIVFKIVRSNPSIYSNKLWSFAILTQGTKVDNVVGFCKSIRKFDSSNKHQIIICGPEHESYNQYNVQYLNKKYSQSFPEISLKKNDIIDLCENENILISHDRYKLNDDFFLGFERYGYDFDFLTIRQQYESGEKFPSYLRLDQRLKWSRVSYTDDETLYDDRFFLNGGLLISKKQTVSKVKFNSTLFWNEAEDVEISSQMILNSIPPRQNYFSSATTLGLTTDYTATFHKIKYQNTAKLFTRIIYKLATIIKRRLPQKWKNSLKKTLNK